MGEDMAYLDMGRSMRRLLKYLVDGDLGWNGYHEMESNGLTQEAFKGTYLGIGDKFEFTQ